MTTDARPTTSDKNWNVGAEVAREDGGADPTTHTVTTALAPACSVNTPRLDGLGDSPHECGTIQNCAKGRGQLTVEPIVEMRQAR